MEDSDGCSGGSTGRRSRSAIFRWMFLCCHYQTCLSLILTPMIVNGTRVLKLKLTICDLCTVHRTYESRSRYVVL